MNEQSRETVTHPQNRCMCDAEWNQQYESWNRATMQIKALLLKWLLYLCTTQFLHNTSVMTLSPFSTALQRIGITQITISKRSSILFASRLIGENLYSSPFSILISIHRQNLLSLSKLGKNRNLLVSRYWTVIKVMPITY